MKGLHGLLPPRVRSQDEQVENGLKNSKLNYITYSLCHLFEYQYNVDSLGCRVILCFCYHL